MRWLDLKQAAVQLCRVLRLTVTGFLDDRAPRMGATVASQSDLPGSVPATSLANTGRLVYAELLP